jgi:hypothetical protein
MSGTTSFVHKQMELGFLIREYNKTYVHYHSFTFFLFSTSFSLSFFSLPLPLPLPFPSSSFLFFLSSSSFSLFFSSSSLPLPLPSPSSPSSPLPPLSSPSYLDVLLVRYQFMTQTKNGSKKFLQHLNILWNINDLLLQNQYLVSLALICTNSDTCAEKHAVYGNELTESD